MRIAIPVFDGMTALDAVGPYEVLSRLPGAEVLFVAESAGLIRTDNKFLGISADRALAEVDSADILLVPGGPAVPIDSARLLEWLRRIDRTSTWTTSVCTGALLLGAAGLLRGLKATTHWAAFDQLAQFGATPVAERVVEQGKVITAAGVSAGIDMGLRLAARIAGDEFAQMIQLFIEYDPQPPFDCGSPRKASEAVMRRVAELRPQPSAARAS
jgi:transcriptional regulator GlxA family with amidase domain